MIAWNYAARPEYATAKIAVWWDMDDCPIPEGYDARRVRPSIEGAFKKLCYSGPVSITAYGDQTKTPAHLLRGLSSTGVAVAHTLSQPRCSFMFSDMLEWRGHNPPPATMMIISNQVDTVFSWELARLQQETRYNLFLAYSLPTEFGVGSDLFTSAKWLWKELLPDTNKHEEDIICSELSAMFYCKSCNFQDQRLEKFREHLLRSKDHELEETTKRKNPELDPVTRKSELNQAAKPEYATAKIAVWWDMYDCPIPEGYDARRVRPSIEGAFKKLGYSGPVSITAYGDHTQTPAHLLQGLSSTGVAVAHTFYDINYKRMSSDMLDWRIDNRPPATMMIISDQVEDSFSFLVSPQQRIKYNLFLAYSFRPYKMSILLTSAEWLWDSLLAVSETSRPLLQLSTVSETTRPLLQLSTVSETSRPLIEQCSERGESTGMFYCRSCDDDIDYKSLDNLRKHLSSEEHALEVADFYESFRRSQYELARQEAYSRRSKCLRKAFPMGFRLLHNHLRFTNRGARKSQRHKKVW